MIGTLYIVATPIGNLEDITLRALRILREVDVILCEDTRHTKKLLNHYDISTKTVSFHAHSEKKKMQYVEKILHEGKNVALVSDAGTPLISDPGSSLLSFLREYSREEIHISPIPGPSALTSALSVIPLPSGHFTFLGFLPQKKGRRTTLSKMKEGGAYVFYESSHRILKLLSELEEIYPEAHTWIARELTKQFEEVLSGSPKELKDKLEADQNKQKGEFVVALF